MWLSEKLSLYIYIYIYRKFIFCKQTIDYRKEAILYIVLKAKYCTYEVLKAKLYQWNTVPGYDCKGLFPLGHSNTQRIDSEWLRVAAYPVSVSTISLGPTEPESMLQADKLTQLPTIIYAV